MYVCVYVCVRACVCVACVLSLSISPRISVCVFLSVSLSRCLAVSLSLSVSLALALALCVRVVCATVPGASACSASINCKVKEVASFHVANEGGFVNDHNDVDMSNSIAKSIGTERHVVVVVVVAEKVVVVLVFTRGQTLPHLSGHTA